MPILAQWSALRCDITYVVGGRVGMYLSQLVALANTLDPYYLLINTPAPPPESAKTGPSAPQVRHKCGTCAAQVRQKRAAGAQVYFQNERFAWEVSQKRCSWFGQGALLKSLLQNVRFASAGAPFCLQIITFP